MRRLREVLDEGGHQVLEHDQAVDIPPLYLPLQELCFRLLKLPYNGAQVPLVQLLQPPHLLNITAVTVRRTQALSC